MSILVDENTRVVVQGMGRDGAFHAKAMRDYGTQVVAGVNPGKGGRWIEGTPVFNTVAEAVRETAADTSIVFVPAKENRATDALFEAIDAGVKLIVCVTEGIPTRDASLAIERARCRGSRILGPNSPGVISPGKAKVGIMPAGAFRSGCVGVISRSGTLTYEIASHTQEYGQSSVVGVGGDSVIGTDFIHCLALLNDDPATQAIVIVGEIGGTDEERAAQWVKRNCRKPVFGFIAGWTAPPGKKLGHAGAIIEGSHGTAKEKGGEFLAAGIQVFRWPCEVSELLAAKLGPPPINGCASDTTGRGRIDADFGQHGVFHTCESDRSALIPCGSRGEPVRP